MALIKLRHVNSFRDKIGKTRHYFRRKGDKAVALPGAPGSKEFMEAYAAAMAERPLPIVAGRDQNAPGTVAALIVAYYATARWRQFSTETQRRQRNIIENFRDSYGNYRVIKCEPKYIAAVIDKIVSPHVRNETLKALRALFDTAVPSMLAHNPCASIKVKVPKSQGHHTWTEEEIEQYRAHWPNGTMARLTLEFAFEAASRRCEVVNLAPQHCRKGRIRIERAKGSDPVDIQISAELQAAIDAMPRNAQAPFAPYLANADGSTRSPHAFGKLFAQWATEAGLPARCRMHGLKKSSLTRAANAGASAHDLMGLSGHRTLAMVLRYTTEADRKRGADRAMAKVREAKTATEGTKIGDPKLQNRS
jgi:integrase